MTDRIEYDDDGGLDEIVSPAAHLERMDADRWFLVISQSDGKEVCIWFRGHVTHHEIRPAETGEPVR